MNGAALELRDVRKRFGATDIIRGIDLQVERGERLALIGPNGAGKSTLFNLVSGGIAPDLGEILLNGTRIDGLPAHRISRLGLSRSFQVTNLFHRLSVIDNLRCAVLWSLGYRYAFWRRMSRLHDVHERADAVLESVGLQSRRDVEAGRLSYAEQRALEIGVTIAGGAEVILLDEPTAGMSRAESDGVAALVRKVTEGKTLLMVEHDMQVVFGLADRIAVLAQGELIACGSADDIRNDARVREAYLGSEVEA